MEEFVAPLVEGGGTMGEIAANAMAAVTTVFTWITDATRPELAALAVGFPAVMGAAKALKRIIRV